MFWSIYKPVVAWFFHLKICSGFRSHGRWPVTEIGRRTSGCFPSDIWRKWENKQDKRNEYITKACSVNIKESEVKKAAVLTFSARFPRSVFFVLGRDYLPWLHSTPLQQTSKRMAIKINLHIKYHTNFLITSFLIRFLQTTTQHRG